MHRSQQWGKISIMGSKRPHNEQGIVSIVVTIIVLVVLTLITIGFSTLTRREKRQSLDKQLSAQAFYAAESGINAARDAIINNGLVTKTDCVHDGFKSDGVTTVPVTTTLSGNVSVSCLLVSTTVPDVQFVPAKQLTSNYVALNSADGVTPFTTITISWNEDPEKATPSFRPSGSTDFTTGGAAWGSDAGVVRIALTDLNPVAGYLDRDILVQHTITDFLYPDKDATPKNAGNLTMPWGLGGLIAANDPSQGQIVSGHCNAGSTAKYPRKCTVNIDVSARGSKNFFLRITPYYQDAAITITGVNGVSKLAFVGAQAIVDATGKAQDVLRRVQVRIPETAVYSQPEFAINAGNGFCKRIQVAPPAGIQFVDPPSGSDPSCQLLSTLSP